MSEYRQGCTGKVPFFSEQEAKRYIRSLKNRVNQTIYHCHYLSFAQEHWHLTSIPRGLLKKTLQKKIKYANYATNRKIARGI